MDSNSSNALTHAILLEVAPGPYAAYEVVSLVRRTSKLEWTDKPGGGVSTYKGGIYCGPGWGFTKQDVVSGKVAKLPEAIDAIDEACRHHDQCYDDHGYFTKACNVRLATELTQVVISLKSTPQQRLDAATMAAIFATESRIDPALKLGHRGYQKLQQFYQELINSGAEFMFVIEQGIWRTSQTGSSGGSF